MISAIALSKLGTFSATYQYCTSYKLKSLLCLSFAQHEIIIEPLPAQERDMEFEEFTALYPSLSREQVARVAGCSVALVNRWAMTGETGRDPGEDHKTRFDIAHWFWTRESKEPSFFEELRQIRREAGL